MSRAGREPAEDVKRRIVAACKEADLEVQGAKMYLRREHKDRAIVVSSFVPDGSFRTSMIDITTAVRINGDWPGTVHIGCLAADDHASPNDWNAPIMQGRDAVPLDELAEQLRKTVEEREQVVAALKIGMDGPFQFGEARWERLSDIVEPP